jgi:integrase/recombinase XerD
MFRSTVSLYLDVRKMLKGPKHGLFPVKVRFTTKVGASWKQFYYATGFNVTEEDWEKIKGGSVRGELRMIRERVMAREQEALKILEKAPFIKPEQFDAIFTGRQSTSAMVKGLFDEMIIAAEKDNRISTAGSYKDTRNALVNYGGEALTLGEIDKEFLQGFERQMRKPYRIKNEKKDRPGRSSTTIGIYMRNLRTAYNLAIERHIISGDGYPFGRKRYTIPSSRNIKKALTEADKNKLIHFKPKTPAAARALAAWTFSYYCNGMNFSDMAHLKRGDIRGDVLTFRRNKTSRTKQDQKPTIVLLRKETLEILRHQVGEPFIFGVIDEKDLARRRKARIHEWIKKTNEQLGKICKELKIEKVTTYTARHTAATMLLRAGADLVYIRDVLGHSSVKTTENYVASLDLEEQRKMTERL